jgi:hypothetical protein
MRTRPSEAEASGAEAVPDATKEWFWEGNVTDAVARYLGEQGWRILSQADTRTKERGLDLHALRGNQEIMVEVKGYPSRSTATKAGPANGSQRALLFRLSTGILMQC